MPETSKIMELIVQNPKVATGTAVSGMWAFHQIIFDPYRSCSLFYTVASIVTTYTLIWGFAWVSFEAWNMEVREALKTLTSLAGLLGTCYTSYAVYKKTARGSRRRNITRTKNGKN